MQIGVSTACFYPAETETALKTLANGIADTVEIFFNAECELSGDIYREISSIVRENGISVLSVHPYTSALETMSLFGNYPRRLTAMLDSYRRYFEIMNELGAKIFILHGALKSADCSESLYFERYSMLYELGRSFGVTVAQENVSYCKSGNNAFLQSMKRQLGSDCAFVLDVKQALRSGTSPFTIMELLGSSIVHYHLSDNTTEKDCIPVGKGKFDFPLFAQILKKSGYSGGIILELYRSGFSAADELKKSVDYMKRYF